MPIAFACECGKSFSVGDEHAGKRTKCPKCGAALTVPTPTAPEMSDEDKAFAALEDAPDYPRPAPRYEPSYDPPPRGPAIPAAAAAPPKLSKPSKEERKARKERRARPYDPDRGRKILYIIGGVLMMVAGGALGFFAIDSGGSIHGGVFGFFLVIGGISTFFQGVTGQFNEE